MRLLWSCSFGLLVWLLPLRGSSQVWRLPTDNRAILAPGGEDRYFAGTAGKPWISGTFGSVRTDGRQIHEGLDIRCLQRDKKGEPLDPVCAVADGAVVYINAKPGLSNYGNYLVLRHQIEGIQVYSLYAHLRRFQAGLRPGQGVKAGDALGIMGRTSNTPEVIARDRAHLHFELNLLVNERFAAWYQKNCPSQRNDHGAWNGRNLAGFDPRPMLLAQAKPGGGFSLLPFLRQQTELCRVLVRKTDFPWIRRYPAFVLRNPRAEKEGVAGYEISLNFNGLAFRLVPRAAAEIRGQSAYQLLTVNAEEQRRNPGRHLVAQQGGRWRLTQQGLHCLDLLAY